MRRITSAAAAMLLGLASVGFGERATTSFDELEAGVVELQNSIVEPRDRETNRASKVYVKTITKLSRDTKSLKAEIKRGRQILPRLAKLGIPEVDDLVTNSVFALADEVYGVLDEAQLTLDTVPAKATRKKTQRQIDIARTLLQRGVAAVKVKKRIAFLLKAEVRARKALKLASRVEPSQPGIGDVPCPGRQFGPGERVQISADGGRAVDYESFAFRTFIEDDLTLSRFSFYLCEGTDVRVVNVQLPVPTLAGSYDGAEDSRVSFSAGLDGTELPRTTDGTAELVEVISRIEIAFDFTLDGVRYEGSVDIGPIR